MFVENASNHILLFWVHRPCLTPLEPHNMEAKSYTPFEDLMEECNFQCLTIFKATTSPQELIKKNLNRMQTSYRRESLKIINIISESLATNHTFKRSSRSSERNLMVYIHRPSTVCFPSGKVNFHVSLICKVVISSSIALFYPGFNITWW